jgi:serine/threonine protein kinase
MTPADDPFYPGGTFGRYQLIERVGEGGMASVWKALHLGLRKHVAIKTLRADLTQSEKARERFLREGEAIARIRHAHVVEVHDVGIAGDTPYLVMEFLEGEDLRAYFQQRAPLPLAELADLMVPVCAALATAHDEGVVHRDIKPGNLFLARTRDRGLVP